MSNETSRTDTERQAPGKAGALALRICAVYAVLGSVYIVASDLGLFRLIAPELPGALMGGVVPLSIAKGVAFILVTAGLLFLGMRRSFVRIDRQTQRTDEVESARGQLADALPDIYFELDMRARVSGANRRATVVTGKTHDEILGTPAIYFVDEKERPAVEHSLAGLIEDGKPQVIEGRLLTAEGSRP